MDKKRTIARKIWLNTIIIAVFVCVVICCTSILRNILWKNNNVMGLSLI